MVKVKNLVGVKKMMDNLKVYLTLLEQRRIEPNFFTSEAYLRASKVHVEEYQGLLCVLANKWNVLTPIEIQQKNITPVWILSPIWAALPSLSYEPRYRREFLDYEYLYDSKQFNDLSGHKWNVYRKNIRKWPKAHQNWQYLDVTPTTNLRQVLDIVLKWTSIKRKEVQDFDTIWEYFTKHFDLKRMKILYNGDGIPVGVNAWDESWKYINFRFCLNIPDQPFIQEFLRHQFYTDPEIQTSGKLINDGGVMDSPGLEKFKDKLHPVEKRIIHSLLPV